MRIKVKYNQDGMQIYREMIGVMVFAVVVACAFLGMGALFITIDDENRSWWLMFAITFIGIGSAWLLYLPFYFRKLWAAGGAVLLDVNHQRMQASPELNVKPVEYSWHDIDRVITTRRFIHKDSEGTTFARPKLIMILKSHVMHDISLADRAIKQLWKSPKGNNAAYIDLPLREVERIQMELQRFAPSGLDIRNYAEVIFDNLESTERYLP